MEKWVGKVAVVIGANGGLGTEVSKILSENGMTVIGVSKESVKLQIFSAEVNKKIHVMRCKFLDEDEVCHTFKEIEEQFGGVDVLINNAEISEVLENNFSTFNTFAIEALRSMKSRAVSGYIINLNNNAMIKSSIEKLRSDLRDENSSVKISNIVTLKSKVNMLNNKEIDLDACPDLIPSDFSKVVVALLSFPTYVEVKEIIMESPKIV